MPTIKCSNPSCDQTMQVDSTWSPAFITCKVCNSPHYVPYRIEEIEVGYCLQAFRERLPSQTFPLKEGKNTIGRKNCDVMLPTDTTISRRHCIIEIRKDSRGNWQCLLYDIGCLEGTESTNGVFVDGRSQRLNNREQHIFQIGDQAQIGRTIIQLDSKSK